MFNKRDDDCPGLPLLIKFGFNCGAYTKLLKTLSPLTLIPPVTMRAPVEDPVALLFAEILRTWGILFE